MQQWALIRTTHAQHHEQNTLAVINALSVIVLPVWFTWLSSSRVPKPLQFSVNRLLVSLHIHSLFIVIEQTGRINLASFSNLQCNACDHLCCLKRMRLYYFHTVMKGKYNTDDDVRNNLNHQK